MPYDKNFCDSPMKPLADPPANYKGGPGTYDGEKGYPERTADSNAAPEKVREGNMPTTQDSDVGFKTSKDVYSDPNHTNRT